MGTVRTITWGLTHRMLGAAGRAASGLVKQSFVSSNVAKLLPASQQRQFSVSQPVDNHKGKVVSVIGAVVDVQFEEGNDLYHEMIEGGVISLKDSSSKVALVYGQMNEPPGARARVALTGLTVAEYFRDQEGQDVLLFID